MSAFCYENYFNDSFELEDFYEIVNSLVVDAKPVEVVEQPKKKAKKSYAMQIGELKQEIISLRQEIEIQNHQMLSLIQEKSK
jgi:hypothetical protein